MRETDKLGYEPPVEQSSPTGDLNVEDEFSRKVKGDQT
jgi:hypothetical protein